MSIKLESLKQNSSSRSVYNILVLGETGSGKSTTINALANYLKYNSFEEACATSEFLNLVPSQFALAVKNQDEPFLVKHGEDANECPNDDGASCTQEPKGYVFCAHGKTIRIIDTPGMGDTTGIDKDQEHFDKILNFIGRLDYLHGICIIVKATETKQNALFKYCISELFLHLHQDACRNVVFCFTYSQVDDYDGGDGYENVRQFLKKELPNLKLKKGDNCFFIDNEAYRLVLAKQKGYKMADKRLESGKESWKESAMQIQSMIDHIIGIEPHAIVKTKLLDDTKKMLLNMAEPLVRLETNIGVNIQRIKAEEKRLQSCATDKLELAMQNLVLKLGGLKRENQKFPTTVCTEDKCVEVIIINGEYEIDYKTRCHEPCNLTNVETNAIGHPKLKNCAAMNDDDICKNCNCSWEKHQHIRYKVIEVEKSIDLSGKGKEKTLEKRLSRALRTMQILDKEYSHELEVIRKSTSKFAYILSTYSNWPVNEYTEPYLELLIKEEKRKINNSLNASRAKYDLLIEMSQGHRKMVQTLTEAIQNKTREIVRIEDIEQIKNKLIRLKHSGNEFKQLIEDNITAKAKEFVFVEDLGLELFS